MSTPKDFFIEFTPGTDVFSEGDVGQEMYIVESGQIDLVHENGDPIASIGPGEFFGEAAVDGKPHAMSARASTKSRVLRIERAAFPDVVKQNPEIAVRILKQVVARLSRPAPVAMRAEPAKPAAAAKPAAPPKSVDAPKAPELVKPVEPVKAAEPVAPPAPPLAQKTLALRAAGSDQVIALDAARSDFLVGRPDPATGVVPEIDLGPFNADGTLSRKHARVAREGSLYFLQEESGVANGTFLNGERVPANTKVPIKPGDKLRFGLIEVDVISV
jgi:hypothetical protein